MNCSEIIPIVQKQNPSVIIIGDSVVRFGCENIFAQCRCLIPNAKIIYVSKKQTITQRLAHMYAGADDVLCQPISYYEVFIRIKRYYELVRDVVKANLNICYYWDKTLELSNGNLFERSNPCREVALTKQQEIILKNLMMHTLLPVEFLMRETKINSKNTLAVTVHRLNIILQNNSFSVVIRSRYGRGYSLNRLDQESSVEETPKSLSLPEGSESQP
jgi:DNA-binding response OmpR family regulator